MTVLGVDHLRVQHVQSFHYIKELFTSHTHTLNVIHSKPLSISVFILNTREDPECCNTVSNLYFNMS